MYLSSYRVLLGLLSVLLPLAACGERGAVPADEGTNYEVQTASEPESIDEGGEVMIEADEGPSLLESATLINAEDVETEDFLTGDTLRVRVVVREVPAGLATWVHWFGEGDEPLARDQKTVPPDGRVILETASSGWEPGTYRAEVYVGGDLVDTRPFRLRSR